MLMVNSDRNQSNIKIMQKAALVGHVIQCTSETIKYDPGSCVKGNAFVSDTITSHTSLQQ